MYISEAQEHVETMNQALLKLEENPEDRENLDLIFRSAHTLKGMAATMGYEQTTDLCRNIENVFDKIRKKESQISVNLASALFNCIDVLQQMINDESKKIDIKSFLKMLENPDEIKKQINNESMYVTQLPTIRVKMSELDSLVNLIGELIISKMKLEKSVISNDFAQSQHSLNELNRLVSDLQYQSLKLRLVPIETIFKRVSRVVRDTSNTVGKKIELQMNGANIELDRTVLDSITEPLLHILRNCVDHGIEVPSERKKIGKPENGKINLTAYNVADQIAIKIEDDGKGIDVEKLKAKAIEKGIISIEEADTMSDEKAIDLLGTPGLSTANEITDISGRGVGMDVVINRVRDVGGNFEISTKKGKGTTMILTLPLNVSIIRGLLVNVSNEKYVVPLSTVITTIKVDNSQIKSIHGVEVIELQDKIIPLVRVDKILKLKSTTKLENKNTTTIIIVEKGGKSYGLVVDSFERNQEIVVKKFSNASDSTNAFTNATILPDGKVALILDPAIIV
jgi:two-component system chemotaxis sensor kinase CheA